MAKRALRGAIPVLALFLSACGITEAAPPPQSLPHYFPVSRLVSRLTKVGFQPSQPGWHTLSRLPLDATVDSVTTDGILVTTLHGSPPGWQSGLYWIHPSTGQVTPEVWFGPGQQADVVAMSQSWLVYEIGRTRQGGYSIVMAKNLATGVSWPILTLSPTVYSAGNIRGLVIRGNRAYWLSNVVGPEGLESRLYVYDFKARALRVLEQVRAKTDGLMFFDMVAAPHGLWISVNNSGNAGSAVNGSLWYWSLEQNRITRKIPVWHSPTLLYGASDNTVIFSANYRPAPTSRANPAPYPLYADDWTTGRVYQLTSGVNPGGAASVDGPNVTVNGLGIESAMINLQHLTITFLPVPRAMVGGHWLVLQGPHSISWGPLPNARSGGRPTGLGVTVGTAK